MNTDFILEYDGKHMFARWCKKNAPTSFFADDRLVRVDQKTNLEILAQDQSWLKENKLVAKVDQLVKRRGKLGLVKVNMDWNETSNWLANMIGRTFEIDGISGVLKNFLVEPALPHTQDSEMYIAIRVRSFTFSHIFCFSFDFVSALPRILPTFLLWRRNSVLPCGRC